MALAVVTVAAGGLPVVDVTAVAPRAGLPVTEATNGRGIAVTLVIGGGLPIIFVPMDGGASAFNPSDKDVDVTPSNLTATGGMRTSSDKTSGRGFIRFRHRVTRMIEWLLA
jgi:hypothetical protein